MDVVGLATLWEFNIQAASFFFIEKKSRPKARHCTRNWL